MSYRAVAFRAADYETPLWSFADITAARYNRADRGPATQYLSFHPMTPWAELIRNLDLRDPDDACRLRLPIWTIRLELADDPFELTYVSVDGFARAADDLVADEYDPCRGIAEALHARGVASFTAPSAGLPGTRNLVVLQPAVVVDFNAEPFDQEDWPTALISKDGRCPQGLWEHVHYKNSASRHPELDAWVNGDACEFEQPLVDAATVHR